MKAEKTHFTKISNDLTESKKIRGDTMNNLCQ